MIMSPFILSLGFANISQTKSMKKCLSTSTTEYSIWTSEISEDTDIFYSDQAFFKKTTNLNYFRTISKILRNMLLSPVKGTVYSFVIVIKFASWIEHHSTKLRYRLALLVLVNFHLRFDWDFWLSSHQSFPWDSSVPPTILFFPFSLQ